MNNRSHHWFHCIKLSNLIKFDQVGQIIWKIYLVAFHEIKHLLHLLWVDITQVKALAITWPLFDLLALEHLWYGFHQLTLLLDRCDFVHRFEVAVFGNHRTVFVRVHFGRLVSVNSVVCHSCERAYFVQGGVGLAHFRDQWGKLTVVVRYRWRVVSLRNHWRNLWGLHCRWLSLFPLFFRKQVYSLNLLPIFNFLTVFKQVRNLMHSRALSRHFLFRSFFNFVFFILHILSWLIHFGLFFNFWVFFDKAHLNLIIKRW